MALITTWLLPCWLFTASTPVVLHELPICLSDCCVGSAETGLWGYKGRLGTTEKVAMSSGHILAKTPAGGTSEELSLI